MARLTRRSFFKHTLATAATVTVAGTKSSGKVLGANDTVRAASRTLTPAREGVQPVHFDWFDESTYALALEGADAVYLQVLDISDLDHLRLIAEQVVPQLGG